MKKTVLITGGNKGIGLETTRLMQQLGYKVTVVARDFSETSLHNMQDVTLKQFDLKDVDGIPKLISEIGHVDVLINNAGVMYSVPYNAYPPEKVDSMLKLNIEAPVALIREV
jgi:NADP-dependent 3-hydroxy acid dehydrogenase YdfG